jgi:hypothetical protein
MSGKQEFGDRRPLRRRKQQDVNGYNSPMSTGTGPMDQTGLVTYCEDRKILRKPALSARP